MAHEEKSSTLAMCAVISQLSIFIADCAHVTCDVSMRTMTNEIWLSAAINASLHVNIFPGQGDTKASTNLVGPGVAMTTSHMSLQSGYSWHSFGLPWLQSARCVTSFVNCSELWFHIQCYYIR